MAEEKTIRIAEFSPMIRKYIFWMGIFILLCTVFGIPLILFWVAGFGQRISNRYFDSLECSLTNRSLRFKKGIWIRVDKTIPLENIQDLTYVEGPILQFFELCVLKIETAGNSSQTSSDMRLLGIRDARNFRKMVLEQRELAKNPVQVESGSTNEIPELLRGIQESLNRIEQQMRK